MEKHIKKLKQLDRIEYRIKESVILNSFGQGVTLGWILVAISLIITVTLPVNKIISGEIIPYLFFLALFASLLAFVSIVSSTSFYIKNSRELNKEYFDFNVVVKK